MLRIAEAGQSDGQDPAGSLRWMRVQPSYECESVFAGHGEVADNDVGTFPLGHQLDRLGHRVSGESHGPQAFQEFGHGVARVAVVFDYDDSDTLQRVLSRQRHFRFLLRLADQGIDRQRYRERRAPVHPLALRINVSAVQFNQFARDRKPEPEAVIFARGRTVGLAEGFEDERQEFAADTFAGILDGQHRMAIAAFETDADQAAGRGEFHRVREQVRDYLLETLRIAVDAQRRAVPAPFNAPLLGLGRRPDHVQRAVDKRHQIDHAITQLDLAPRYAREVENFIDQRNLEMNVALDNLECMSGPLRIEIARAQQMNPPDYGIQRISQFVRDRREEFFLDAVGHLGPEQRLVLGFDVGRGQNPPGHRSLVVALRDAAAEMRAEQTVASANAEFELESVPLGNRLIPARYQLVAILGMDRVEQGMCGIG